MTDAESLERFSRLTRPSWVSERQDKVNIAETMRQTHNQPHSRWLQATRARSIGCTIALTEWTKDQWVEKLHSIRKTMLAIALKGYEKNE